MKVEDIAGWLDETLEVARFDDVSNNGLQIGNDGAEVDKVAFAVDADLKSVKAAVASGAGLLVVHHGISWGGGIRRLTGGIYNVVKAAMDGNLAVYACHLPLDAHRKLGNNALLAKKLGLKRLKRAFSYHGNTIGFTGVDANGDLVGVCSGGAGAFAEEAKSLGCRLFVTGEASWGETVAAENCAMPMKCLGHYDTEVYGVSAVAAEMKKRLLLKIVDLTKEPV